jgi:hypothetical protein
MRKRLPIVVGLLALWAAAPSFANASEPAGAYGAAPLDWEHLSIQEVASYLDGGSMLLKGRIDYQRTPTYHGHAIEALRPRVVPRAR